MSFVKEFKEFISKGNVMELAIGIVIGAAFGKIVTSFVNDILMPPIGVILNGVDFKHLKFTLQQPVIEQGKLVSEEVTLNYGNFIQSLVDFLIVAFAIFLVVKLMNRLKKKEAEKAAEVAAPTNEEKLLGEIRDILKSK